MSHSPSRRQLLKRLAFGAVTTPLAIGTFKTWASDQALLAPSSQAAQKVHYVEDAKKAKDASAGASCANCALYQGASGSSQGPCQLFPENDVVSTGWCSSWASQM
jgi:hypothetical protein